MKQRDGTTNLQVYYDSRGLLVTDKGASTDPTVEFWMTVKQAESLAGNMGWCIETLKGIEARAIQEAAAMAARWGFGNFAAYDRTENMVADTKNRPFINGEENEQCPYSWAGHPSCETPGPAEQYIIENRDHIVILGDWVENEPYSYDEWLLVSVRGLFYVLTTSGCSCPSPSETWYAVTTGHPSVEAALDDAESSDRYCCKQAIDSIREKVNVPRA